MRLGQLELVLQGVFLRDLRRRYICRELCDALLVGIEQLLGLLQVGLDLQGRGTEFGRMGLDIAQGGGECQGELMVRHAQRGLNEWEFLRRRRQLLHALGGAVGALVHQSRGCNGGGALCDDRR